MILCYAKLVKVKNNDSFLGDNNGICYLMPQRQEEEYQEEQEHSNGSYAQTII